MWRHKEHHKLVITIMKTTCSGLDAAVDTPGKGAAGLTKLALVFALAVSPLLLARPTSATDTLPILWEAGGQSSGNDGAGQAARVAVDLTGMWLSFQDLRWQGISR